MNNLPIDDSSVSAYITENYEGLDTTFGEVSHLPSRGYCDLYRAKRDEVFENPVGNF